MHHKDSPHKMCNIAATCLCHAFNGLCGMLGLTRDISQCSTEPRNPAWGNPRPGHKPPSPNQWDWAEESTGSCDPDIRDCPPNLRITEWTFTFLSFWGTHGNGSWGAGGLLSPAAWSELPDIKF